MSALADLKYKLAVVRQRSDAPAWLNKIEAAERPAPSNRKRIAAMSGGKDSTAMCLAMALFEPGEVTYVITPTGNELPEMYEHWKKLHTLLGAPIMPVGRQTLQGLIRSQVALPSHAARWCTRIVKLEAYYGWLADQGPCVSHVGLRADEESRPGMVFPDTDHVQMDFPMRRWGWTIDDVLAFLDDMGVTVPARTDCAMCFWQKLGEWWLLWRDHPDMYAEAEGLEEFVIAGRGKIVTLRSPQRDTWPARLSELRARFEAGDIPQRSLNMMDKRRQVGTCRVCTL